MSRELPGYVDLPIRRFLDDTASDQPTPGGGSVAALVAALAGATGRMAVSYTLGRDRYSGVQADVRVVAGRLAKAQAMAEELVAEDMVAFEALQAAMRGKTDPPVSSSEKAAALVGAIGVPFEVVTVAAAILGELDQLKDIANPHLLSDVGVAAELAMAAVRAAAINVRINLPQVADVAEREGLSGQLAEALGHAEARYRRVAAYVGERL